VIFEVLTVLKNICAFGAKFLRFGGTKLSFSRMQKIHFPYKILTLWNSKFRTTLTFIKWLLLILAAEEEMPTARVQVARLQNIHSLSA